MSETEPTTTIDENHSNGTNPNGNNRKPPPPTETNNYFDPNGNGQHAPPVSGNNHNKGADNEDCSPHYSQANGKYQTTNHRRRTSSGDLLDVPHMVGIRQPQRPPAPRASPPHHQQQQQQQYPPPQQAAAAWGAAPPPPPPPPPYDYFGGYPYPPAPPAASSPPYATAASQTHTTASLYTTNTNNRRQQQQQQQQHDFLMNPPSQPPPRSSPYHGGNNNNKGGMEWGPRPPPGSSAGGGGGGEAPPMRQRAWSNDQNHQQYFDPYNNNKSMSSMPSYHYPAPPLTNPQQQQQQPQQQPLPSMHGSSNDGGGGGRRHQRTGSWTAHSTGGSGNLGNIQNSNSGPWPPTHFASERMGMHSNRHESNSLLAQQQPRGAGGGRRRERKHRRSQSSSAATTHKSALASTSYGSMNASAYGSFWSGVGSEGANQKRGSSVSPSQQQRKATTHFSPRDEFMNLASLSPRPPPPSSGQPSTPPGNAGAGVIGSKSYRLRSSPQVSWSPNAATYMSNQSAAPAANIPNLVLSPFVNDRNLTISTSSAGSSNGGGGGGEAVYLAQSQRRLKPESSRKRHMRQRSAQLFMSEFKGRKQPPACRNVFFLLLFVFHLLGMVYLSNAYSYEAFRYHDPVEAEVLDSVTINYKNLLMVAGFSGIFAMCLSVLLLGVMTFFSRRFVQVALFVMIFLSFIWGTVGIGLSPENIVPITGIIALALSVAYSIIVWDRIPFCAVNLLSALTAVRAYPGTIVVTLVFQTLGLAWSIYYAVICCGVWDAIQEGRIILSPRWAQVVYLGLGISYYWTFQVLSNVVEVSTACVVGTWWNRGENTVRTSLFNTIFYFMGSICLGSLLVGPVWIVRQFSVLFRPSSGEGSLLCFHQCLHCLQTCITSCVDGLASRFNPWAFTYIGLYGYGFVEAGERATELFERRGWTKISSDDLVPNILFLTSLVIGGVTGLFGYFLAGLEQLHVTTLEKPGKPSFLTGLAIGLVLTSILFSLICSSVNAVIVCFASSPMDFEQNHPELNHEMRQAWREVWPGALDVVDLNVATGMVLPSPLTQGSIRGLPPLPHGEEGIHPLLA